MKTINPTELSQIIEPLLGLPAWGAELGLGSMLTMEFGGQHKTEDGGAVHGDWHLWITMAAWRWETSDAVIVGSEDDRSTIAARVPDPNGQALTHITVEQPSMETAFHFSQGDIVTFPIYSTRKGTGELGNWVLWTPQRLVISADPDHGLLVEQQSTGRPGQSPHSTA